MRTAGTEGELTLAVWLLTMILIAITRRTCGLGILALQARAISRGSARVWKRYVDGVEARWRNLHAGVLQAPGGPAPLHTVTTTVSRVPAFSRVGA